MKAEEDILTRRFQSSAAHQLNSSLNMSGFGGKIADRLNDSGDNKRNSMDIVFRGIINARNISLGKFID